VRWSCPKVRTRLSETVRADSDRSASARLVARRAPSAGRGSPRIAGVRALKPRLRSRSDAELHRAASVLARVRAVAESAPPRSADSIFARAAPRRPKAYAAVYTSQAPRSASRWESRRQAHA